jgi:hypothetical protein
MYCLSKQDGQLNNGAWRPGVVVSKMTTDPTVVNLQVFTDADNDARLPVMWRTSVHQGDTEGCWQWPESVEEPKVEEKKETPPPPTGLHDATQGGDVH